MHVRLVNDVALNHQVVIQELPPESIVGYNAPYFGSRQKNVFGFFVFEKSFFNYLDENSILEKEPLEKLSKDAGLYAYKHESFWKCMDTYKDTLTLNELWAGGDAPWIKKELK